MMRSLEIYKELSELFVDKGIGSNKFSLLTELYIMAEEAENKKNAPDDVENDQSGSGLKGSCEK